MNLIHTKGVTRFPTNHPQAVARKGTKSAFAQIRSENMQARVFWQLEQTGVAIKIFLIVVLQQPSSCEPAIRQTRQAAWPMQRQRESISTHNSVANIETNEGEQLSSGCLKLAIRAVVALPIQAQMGAQDTSAGYRRDVRNVR